MTEAEWLALEDLPYLIKDRRRAGLTRELRLLACACARRAWGRLPEGVAREAVEVAERFADGTIGRPELDAIQRLAQTAWGQACLGMVGTLLMGVAVASPDASAAALYVTNHAPAVCVPAGTAARRALMSAERAAQRVLFHCVFNNPFRPATLAPASLRPEARSIAQAAYEERELPSGHLDTARLAILADALEEAGCADDDILGHLRSAGPHVRGCWAVDLVLGRG